MALKFEVGFSEDENLKWRKSMEVRLVSPLAGSGIFLALTALVMALRGAGARPPVRHNQLHSTFSLQSQRSLWFAAAAAAAAMCCPHMTLGGGSSSHGDVCPEAVAAWIAAPYIDGTRIHLLTTCYRWTIFCRQCGMRRLSV